jgi:hypothetical protein
MNTKKLLSFFLTLALVIPLVCQADSNRRGTKDTNPQNPNPMVVDANGEVLGQFVSYLGQRSSIAIFSVNVNGTNLHFYATKNKIFGNISFFGGWNLDVLVDIRYRSETSCEGDPYIWADLLFHWSSPIGAPTIVGPIAPIERWAQSDNVTLYYVDTSAEPEDGPAFHEYRGRWNEVGECVYEEFGMPEPLFPIYPVADYSHFQPPFHVE